MSDSVRLDHIRRRIDAVGQPRWSLVADGARMALEGLDAGGARVRILTFETATMDEVELVAAAPDDLRFLLSLLESGQGESPCPGSKRQAAAGPLEGGTETLFESLRPGRKRQAAAGPLMGGTEKSPETSPARDYAAEAAMACARPAWGRFLAERAKADMPADADATAVLLRAALAIRSRKHLNTDGEAASRWKALKAEFMGWMNGYGSGA